MVTVNVDIPALKARHPLGDTVEAAGVRLRGRGRVRQGVCPFHDEAEGSFTVYGDSERLYCFGCGLGGDVLDFVQRTESLTLPEAIARRGASTPDGSGVAQKRGSTWPHGASASPPQPSSVSAMRRAAGCGKPWSPAASPRSASGTRSGSPAWWSSPTSPAASSAGSLGGP